MPRHTRTSALVFTLLVFAALAAHAQQQAPATPPPQLTEPVNPSMAPPPDREQMQMLHQMALERNVDRQKQIIADTQKLLALAQQLKDEVNKSNKDQLSISVVDTANQIEKLAKSVKERMRDGT